MLLNGKNICNTAMETGVIVIPAAVEIKLSLIIL
jgi:hypothetical protein